MSMIQNISAYPIYSTKTNASNVKNNKNQTLQTYPNVQSFCGISKAQVINQPNTTLNETDKKKYLELVQFLKNVPNSPNSENVSASKQLETLLKNGKLLAKTNHDNSTTLDNLHSIITTDRAQGLDKTVVLTSTLDLLSNPRMVTQNFGDIPQEVQPQILQYLKDDNSVKTNPDEMNVVASGTCAAASIEVNMADKFPAEFARWVSELSSSNKEVHLNVKLDSISKNKLEAATILQLLEAQKVGFDYNQAKIKVDLDEGALVRAGVQTHYWNTGERNVADVLVQSAIMKLGSQNTYNSLSDVRKGKFNSNPQGLIELEKTFVESLVKNKEITSLVYQQIDDEQNLVGYNCSFDKIQKHITDTIDSGDDVILGYVLTNETSGATKTQGYKPAVNGAPNKVINGHEITVVDYYKDEKGNVMFVCVDTDDDSPDFVQYSAQWLLPKIHHAGYPAKIVEADEKEIMKYVV